VTRLQHISFAALLCGLAVVGTARAVAASERFACGLAAAAGQGDAETITISFDEAARTATLTTAAGAYAFRNLAVSSVAVSGSAGAVSFGIDRSTLHLVWQRYDDNKTVIRYGACRRAATAGSTAERGGSAMTEANPARSSQ